MIKIPTQDLLYIGTDGILFKGNHLDKFKIGTEIGEYKIVKKDGNELKEVNAIVWGKNNYLVGKDIRISGVHKEITKGMTKEQLNEKFEYWKFPTIDRVTRIDELFKRKYEEKDLNKVKIKTEGLKEYMRTRPLIIDAQSRKE